MYYIISTTILTTILYLAVDDHAAVDAMFARDVGRVVVAGAVAVAVVVEKPGAVVLTALQYGAGLEMGIFAVEGRRLTVGLGEGEDALLSLPAGLGPGRGAHLAGAHIYIYRLSPPDRPNRICARAGDGEWEM